MFTTIAKPVAPSITVVWNTRPSSAFSSRHALALCTRYTLSP